MDQVINLGPRECRKRISLGVGALIFSAVYLIVLIALHLSEFWWLPLFLSLFVGALAILQALEKTCVIHAARGTRVMSDDGKVEKVPNSEISRKLRKKGNRILVKSIILSIIFGVVSFLILKTRSA